MGEAMILSHYLMIFANASVLLILGILYDAMIKTKYLNLSSKVLNGIFLGLTGVIIMSMPWTFRSGVYIDARSILLSVTGLFFGLIPTLIAAAITACYRILIGGQGMLTGVSFIFSASAIGLMFRYLEAKRLISMSPLTLYVMGLITHILMLAMVFLLPKPMSDSLLGHILIPVILLYPIATVLLGYLLINHKERIQMLHRLSDSEAHYRELFFNAPVPYQSLSEEGNLISVNKAWLDTLGYTSEEVLGKNFADFLHPDFYETFKENFPKFRARGEIDGIEFLMRSKRSEYIRALYSGRVVRDEKGKFLHTQCIFHDVTQKRLTEQALQESLKSLQKLFDNAPMGIFRTSVLGKPYHINRGFAKIIGFDDVEEAYKYAAHPDTSFFSDQNRRKEWIEILCRDGRSEGFEFEAVRNDGSKRWLLMNSSKSEDISNNDFYIDGFCIDVTETKHVQENLSINESMMRGILNYMASGTSIYEVLNDGTESTDYKIKFYNRESLWHERKELDEVVGKNLKDLRPNIDSLGLITVMHRVFKTGKAEYMPPAHYVDDSFDNWYDSWVFKLPTGEIVTISNDVTETVLYHETLRSNNIQLETMVQERTQQLEEINRELEAFTHSVAHDLRAPLRSIQGFSNILAEDYCDSLDEEGQKLLQVIIKNTAKMDELIIDLLNLSKLSRKDMKPVQTSIGSVVQDCITELLNEEDSNEYEFIINPLPSISCDPVLIKHVWLNLIGNAIKYTRPSTTKRIEIGYEQLDKESVFYIKDTGVGFNNKYASRLFNLFERGHTSEAFEGSGVGLAIVHRLIMKHDGKVWAQGEENKGAEFYFSIPETPLRLS